MYLLLRHPEVANRNCQTCLKYIFDEETGRMTKGRDGKPELRLLGTNDPAFVAPCRSQTGCPKGTPERPRSLSPQNQQCYQHYLECRAVGVYPADPVVRRNAALIRGVTDAVERARAVEFQHSLLQLIARST